MIKIWTEWVSLVVLCLCFGAIIFTGTVAFVKIDKEEMGNSRYCISATGAQKSVRAWCYSYHRDGYVFTCFDNNGKQKCVMEIPESWAIEITANE